MGADASFPVSMETGPYFTSPPRVKKYSQLFYRIPYTKTNFNYTEPRQKVCFNLPLIWEDRAGDCIAEHLRHFAIVQLLHVVLRKYESRKE